MQISITHSSFDQYRISHKLLVIEQLLKSTVSAHDIISIFAPPRNSFWFDSFEYYSQCYETNTIILLPTNEMSGMKQHWFALVIRSPADARNCRLDIIRVVFCSASLSVSNVLRSDRAKGVRSESRLVVWRSFGGSRSILSVFIRRHKQCF